MKIIITEEQLEYIAGRELLNEGIDEALIGAVGRGIQKAVTGIANGAGKVLKQFKNPKTVAAGRRLIRRPYKGHAINGELRGDKVLGMHPFKFINGQWVNRFTKRAITDPDLIQKLDYERVAHSTAEKLGIGAKHTFRTAAAIGAYRAGKKVANKVSGIKNGYEDFKNNQASENPDAPINTSTATSQDILQSMGFAGTGKSILEPKNSDSVWGRFYDKYGKNQ